MGKYLKKFENHSDYETYISGQDAILPNVSYCEDNSCVHYNPKLYNDNTIYAKMTVPNNEMCINVGAGISFSGYTTNGLKNIDKIIINDWVFERDEYEEFYCQELNAYLYSRPNGGGGKTCFYLDVNPGTYTVQYVLKENVTTNSNYCLFSDNDQVTEVVIPKQIDTFHSNEFTNCSNLASITILGIIKNIAEDIAVGSLWYNNQTEDEPLLLKDGKIMIGFKNESGSLPGEITIPTGVISFISEIQTINIPTSVKYINFHYNSHNYILTFENEDPTDYAYLDDYSYDIDTIYVPANSLNAYKETLPNLANKINPIVVP